VRQLTPVRFYIDGFNLYHALLKLQDNRLKWLDLSAVCKRLIAPKSEVIVGINYFSAFATWLPGPHSRHQQYVSALRATGVNCILGHFKTKDHFCKNCKAQWIGHEEKETDVSIGINLVRDAYRDAYEKAYLVTRDSDLVPAVKMVLNDFPSKSITVVAPPMMGHSNDLTNVSTDKKKITPDQVRACLFPPVLSDNAGKILATMPTAYSKK
jgi:hypothetical protein